MKDQNEEFETYLRQFRLRPGNTRALFPQPANRPRRWWISGIAAALIAAAVIATVETRRPILTIEKTQPPAAPVSGTPSVSPPEAPRSGVREPAPKPSQSASAEQQTIVPRRAASQLERLQIHSPETKGQQIFERVCSACHDLNAASTLHLSTRAEYESYVSMKRSKGAQLSDAEFPILSTIFSKALAKNERGSERCVQINPYLHHRDDIALLPNVEPAKAIL